MDKEWLCLAASGRAANAWEAKPSKPQKPPNVNLNGEAAMENNKNKTCLMTGSKVFAKCLFRKGFGGRVEVQASLLATGQLRQL